MNDQTRRYREGAGYDHSLFPFEPIDRRQPLIWPGGARTAVGVWLYFEHMELDPPEHAVADPRFGGALGSYYPDFQNVSRREFGNRVGIFRILDVLDRLGLSPTVCANAAAARRYPYIVERCLERGYGVVAHGWSMNRMISARMSEQQEADYIGETLSVLEAAFGRRPAGWAGQDYGESPRTPALLAQAGIGHVLDWPNDDVPYLMHTSPPLVSVPNQSEWDDAQLFAVRKVDTWRYPEIVGSAFETLHAEGGRMLGLGLHPWLFGQAHRIRYLEEALAPIAGRDDVWYATSDAIAGAVITVR